VTSVHGPFRVQNRRVNTAVDVEVGETVTTLSSGELAVGGGFLGIGEPVPDADGAPDAAGGAYPAPPLRKNSLVCDVAGTFYQGGVAARFEVKDRGGQVILQPNDTNLRDNTRGWRVLVLRTPARAAAPLLVNWLCRTVDGGGGVLGVGNPDRGYAPAAVRVGKIVHVFYSDGWGKLHHGAQTSTQPDGFSTRELEASGVAWWGRVSALIHQETMHVFYATYDDATERGNLHHGSSVDGMQWDKEMIDGPDSPLARAQGAFGMFQSAASSGDALHLFYLGPSVAAAVEGQEPSGMDLYHAVRRDGQWTVQVLDGHTDQGGRVRGSVGHSNSAVAAPAGGAEVFYYDAKNKNLRHAVIRADGGVTEIGALDGSGDPDPADPSSGQTRADVGLYTTCVRAGADVYVFYHDRTFENLRVAHRSGGVWTFRKLDGGGGSHGRVKHAVGDGYSSSVLVGDQVRVFYHDGTEGTLRCATLDPGANDWYFQVIDGDVGHRGQILNDVGSEAGAVFTPALEWFIRPMPFAHVFYFDDTAKDLRYAFNRVET
jgi:hypothetical protein